MKYLFIFLVAIPLWGMANSDIQSFEYSGDLNPSDYQFGSYGQTKDPVFDVYRTINLDVDLGISSDCGRLDFRSTARGALRNILNTKYLGDIGQNIIGSSPMLLTCYFSPTWCAILKSSRLRANMLAQLRLDQCAVMDNYVDSRAEEYYQEKQDCVRKAIAKSGGNFEQAMESGEINRCKNYMDFDVKNWAGGNGKARENKLLASSAKWSGFKGSVANKTLSLVQSLVGDTVLKRGRVSVDFGPKRVQLTPRTHLMSLERESFNEICKNLMQKVQEAGGAKANVHKVISNDDLKKVSGGEDQFLIDRQTILSLAYLPLKKQSMACRKLSDAVAMTRFSTDMNRSIDFLISKVETNPNVPEQRKKEAARKRRALKEQVEMTLALYHSRNKPLNEVLYQINSQGSEYQKVYNQQQADVQKSVRSTDKVNSALFDCADEYFCNY